MLEPVAEGLAKRDTDAATILRMGCSEVCMNVLLPHEARVGRQRVCQCVESLNDFAISSVFGQRDLDGWCDGLQRLSLIHI
eukprot:7894723-Pyramimonas_sp.AAC.1